jgi:hypothetical protein
MKTLTLISILWACGLNGIYYQTSTDPTEKFKTDFNRVSQAYEKAIEPYLIKFSELQMELLPLLYLPRRQLRENMLS